MTLTEQRACNAAIREALDKVRPEPAESFAVQANREAAKLAQDLAPELPWPDDEERPDLGFLWETSAVRGTASFPPQWSSLRGLR